MSEKNLLKQTYYKEMGISDQQKGVPQPPLFDDIDCEENLIDLPSPEDFDLKPVDFKNILFSRRSVRNYANSPISVEQLSYLLWSSQGVKKIVPGKATFRTVPSAGARHAFETYLLVNNVESLKPGLYKYNAAEHKLILVTSSNEISDDITSGCLGQKFVKTCAATFIWAADFYRMAWRYQKRSYRYLHLDAGHVCQNLYLAAETINCGVCAIAAFDDELMNSILNLDGDKKFVIYIAAAGKKAS